MNEPVYAPVRTPGKMPASGNRLFAGAWCRTPIASQERMWIDKPAELAAGRRLRGLVKAAKRHVIHATAYDLGVNLRKLLAIGAPRSRGRLA